MFKNAKNVQTIFQGMRINKINFVIYSTKLNFLCLVFFAALCECGLPKIVEQLLYDKNTSAFCLALITRDFSDFWRRKGTEDHR